MIFRKSARRARGAALAEVVALAATLSSLGAAAFSGSKSSANKTACAAHLTKLGKALKMYALDNYGKLPSCKLYPGAKAKTDPKSIRKALAEYISTGSTFTCGGAPSKINGYGLGYLWNDAVNGKSLRKLPKTTWLMTDVTAVKAAINSKTAAAKKINLKAIPPAHSGGYNILYADGRVKFSKTPPKITVK